MYRCLIADPPWKFGDSLPGPGRGAVKHYPVMETWEIQRFPLPPLARDSWLFLWYVEAMAEEARAVGRAWGFEPSGAKLTWVKTTSEGALVIDPEGELEEEDVAVDAEGYAARLAFGMGRTVRNCDESCLILRRGRPEVADRAVRSVFFAPVGAHSAKPDRFYGLVQRLVGNGPYAELFARVVRPDVDSWGNEVGRAAPAATHEAGQAW